MLVSADELSTQLWSVEGLRPDRTLKFFRELSCDADITYERPNSFRRGVHIDFDSDPRTFRDGSSLVVIAKFPGMAPIIEICHFFS